MSVHNDPYAPSAKIFPASLETQKTQETKKKDELASLQIVFPENTSKYQVPDPIKGRVFEQSLVSLVNEERNLEALLDKAALLDPNQYAGMQEFVDKIADTYVEKIIQNVHSKQQSPSDFLIPNDELDLDLGRRLEPLILEEAFIKNVPALEVSVVGANILSRGCTVLASGMMLNKINEIIKVKEKSLESASETDRVILQKEIAILKKWAAAQTGLFVELAQESIVSSTLSLPKAGSAIMSLLSLTTTAASQVLDWIGLGVTIIRAAINWRSAQKDVDKHEVWTKVIVNSGTTPEMAQKIVDKQKAVYKSRLEARLKEAGIEIPLEKPTLEQLQAYLSDNNIKDKYDKIVQKREVLSVSLRNALKTFAYKKDDIDKGFLSLALNKAKGVFTAAAVFTALAATLKILVLAGVIATSASMAATGAGVLVVIVGFMIFGAVYLYMKKPNIFKTYIQGLQAKLFFWNIPLAIQKYRLSYSLLEARKVSENVHGIAVRILNVEKLLAEGTDQEIDLFIKENITNKKFFVESSDARKILENYDLELIKQKENVEIEEIALNKELLKLNDSAAGFEEKVKGLQAEINLAGWKDFQLSLEKQITPHDDADIIAHFLLQDDTLLEDTETRKLLLHMDIDLKKLRKLDPSLLQDEIAKGLRAFFAMDTEDTVSMINKRNVLVKYGLRENIAGS